MAIIEKETVMTDLEKKRNVEVCQQKTGLLPGYQVENIYCIGKRIIEVE